MRTIAHVSDLHFGTEVPAVAEALTLDLGRNAPSLLVVSGDLTQRARTAQFEAAREYRCNSSRSPPSERRQPHHKRADRPRLLLIDLLQRLSHREREMVWLAYGQGSTHQEIAGALGLKTGSIKPLLFRARRKLARILRS